MSNQEIKIVDMSHEINAIKSKYGNKYYFKPEAYQEAAKLWGFENHNSHGVITDCRKEIIAHVKSCTAELRLAQSYKGYWLIGISAMTSISGHGYMPSVFDHVGFPSYDDARLAGVRQLSLFFLRESKSNNSCGGKSYKIACEEVIKILEAEEQPQLDMFASLL